jgi:hypothetical protein
MPAQRAASQFHVAATEALAATRLSGKCLPRDGSGFPLMGQRMVTNFSRAGFPSYETIDEDGQAKPCVFGQPWVNPDTLATLHKHGDQRTGPKGEPIAGDALVKRDLR